MEEQRVRIVDIAEELGVSTATVSNVIHGKTRKISAETVRRVQELLEKRQYIPGMAEILLAQNNSRIIGVVVNNHEKYEMHVLEDYFIASSLNYLSREIEKAGYFMMVKVTKDCDEIVRYASMWNMEGLVVIGFCEQDYRMLRDRMHIPFVVYDGYFKESARICNLIVDNYDGGYQMGRYFRELGHQRGICISDNDICMDFERWCGFRDAMKETGGTADFLQIPMKKRERLAFYQKHIDMIKSYTAVFAVSDYYAVDLMRFLQQNGVQVPLDISVAGFDDGPYCESASPALTTIRQDGAKRAALAISELKKLREEQEEGRFLKLPVTLIRRQSTSEYRGRAVK
ncbi:LacI family DNA-binding transcriptional regulator [Marvinbryantia formatexigens]|uniref:LacI family DNA-binding transcriptional regulator n=1 Tax=Marvinbryantia formatexigens TaxID=168384 RepID=UPI0002FC10C8|nr:LacI family DNA-binding transcriptional regulator [Marvinbryantia formatexigens]UWO25916.1 LacI family transcriptional regulator [Marvinbryantia formatexigens DSM 14469]SDF42822.1 transcriptional regulator, LacI family [Marvinbryantia formatexigens]